MDQAAIISKLQVIFDGLFLDPPRLTPALTAKEVPEWDSLLQISLVVAVEKAFDLRFRLGEVEGANNVGEFASLIAWRMAEK